MAIPFNARDIRPWSPTWSPRSATIEHWNVTAQGRLFQVKHILPLCMLRKRKRGPIHGFSNAARLRMLKEFATLDVPKLLRASFITLTWTDERRPGYHDVTRARSWFWRTLEKKIGKCCAFWRVEWELRKTGRHKGRPMPHVHIVAFNVPFIPKGELQAWWKQATKSRQAPRVDVTEIKSVRSCCHYIAKYVAKAVPIRTLVYTAYLNKSQGRCWGIFRKSMLMRCPIHWQRIFEPESISSLDTNAGELWPTSETGSPLSGTRFSARALEFFEHVAKRKAA